MARRHGQVDVDGLAAHFSVTPQTIRKDLNDLCNRELLGRVHGGAVLPTGATNYAYEARRTLNAEGKQRIGMRAAALIPNGASLILNIGTTTEQVALALRGHNGIMAVTNNINVANILREVESAEVVIAGGVVRHSDGGVVGEAAVEFVRQFKVDFAVIGASAIDGDGTILDYDFREVKVSQAIIAHARHTILVTDSSKFSRTAPVRIGNLCDIGTLVTDAPPPEDIARYCAERGVRLEIASDEKGLTA